VSRREETNGETDLRLHFSLFRVEHLRVELDSHRRGNVVVHRSVRIGETRDE